MKTYRAYSTPKLIESVLTCLVDVFFFLCIMWQNVSAELVRVRRDFELKTTENDRHALAVGNLHQVNCFVVLRLSVIDYNAVICHAVCLSGT